MPVKRCIDFCPAADLQRAAVTKSENGISHRTVGINTPDGKRLIALTTSSNNSANNGLSDHPFAIACDEAKSVLTGPDDLSRIFICRETGHSVFMKGKFARTK